MIKKDCSKDDVAACNLIRSHRRSNRLIRERSFVKTITHKLSKECERQLSNSVQIRYDPMTESASVSGCLKYCRCAIFPATRNHLKCINEAGLNYLYRSRANSRRSRPRILSKSLSVLISVEDGYKLTNTTALWYNTRSGHATISSFILFNRHRIS